MHTFKAKVALAALLVACLAESGSAGGNCHPQKKGTKITLNQSNRDTIMKWHAYERELLAAEGYADMHVLHYNTQLQTLAETLSNCKCAFYHSDSSCRQQGTAGFSYIGENLAATSPGGSYPGNNNPDLEKMVKMWDAEKKDWNKNTGQCKPGKVCGHYTQVIWSDTTAVGCALCHCNSGILGMASLDLQCVYGKGGNFGGQLAIHPATGECQTANRCGEAGHGRCIISGAGIKCECEDGYKNQNANQPDSKCVVANGNSGNSGFCNNNNCNNHGSCNDGSCTCNSGWTGNKCQTASSPCTRATCSNHGNCASGSHTCVCDSGYGGSTCSMQTNACNSGYCKHIVAGTCVTVNGAATCPQCKSGWSGAQCNTPVGGGYTPTGTWATVATKVHDKRKSYGRADFSWASTDHKWAVTEAQSCSAAWHSPTETDTNGAHTWSTFLCITQDDTTFSQAWQDWLANTIVTSAPFALSKWTTRAGCAMTSGKNCQNSAVGCPGNKYRLLACKYELAPNHAQAEMGDAAAKEFPEAHGFPGSSEAPAQSLAVPVLAAAVVALAAVVVVLAIKVRRASVVEASDYAEMTA